MTLTSSLILKKTKFLSIFLILIILILITYYVTCVLKLEQFKLIVSEEIFDDDVEGSYKDYFHDAIRPKYILLYTKFFKYPYWESNVDHDVGPEVKF